MKTMSDKSEYIDLSLLSRQELCDLIHGLNDKIKEHNEGSVSGLYVGPGYRDLVKQVFPGNQDTPFERFVLEAQDCIHKLVSMRYHAAVSGAMRWEWSQEAAIHTEISFTMRVV